MSIDKENQYYIPTTEIPFAEYPDNFHFIKRRMPLDKLKISTLSHILWEFFVPYGIKKKYKLDYFHYPYIPVPNPLINKTIVSVLDIVFFIYKEYRPNIFVDLLYKTKIVAVKMTKKIITISESSRKDIIDMLHVNPKIITTIYLDVDRTDETIDIKRFKFDDILESKQYIMYVGGVDYRKNLLRLITAYNQLPELVQTKNQLLLVGNKVKLLNIIEKVTMSNANIIILDSIDNDDLKILYKNAKCFIYPSFYEGFGLPPLEALSYFTPILISDIRVFRELYNGIAIFFNPYDVNSICDKLYEFLVKDISILERKQVEMFLQKFNWDITAKKTLEIYREFYHEL